MKIAPILLLGLLAAPGTGASRETGRSFPLLLSASDPSFTHSEKGLVARIAGFGQTSRPGHPMVPLRVVLVAIPEGAVPDLRITSAVARTMRGVRPALVPGAAVSRGARPGGATGPFALGRVGWLRAQRVVEVLYTPLVPDASGEEARFYPEVRADLLFVGGGAAAGDGAAVRDPHFEETYRKSVINYEQGRSFRAAGGTGGAAASAAVTATVAGSAAGVPRYKLFIGRTGVFRLDHSWMQTHAPELATVDPRTLFLMVEGSEVPLSIRGGAGASGEADGRLDPGDVIEFVGKGKSEPPALLNHDFGGPFPDIFQANDFTDTQIYWLASGGAAGSHPRMQSVDGAPVDGGLPLAGDFAGTALWEENNVYLPLEENDPFFSIPSLLAGSNQIQRDLTVPVPGLAAVTAGARVTVRMRGATDLVTSPDHSSRVWIGNDTGDAVTFAWDGEVVAEHVIDVPQSRLADPTIVHVAVPAAAGSPLDRQYVDSVRIEYRRRFRAAGDTLEFAFANADARFQIDGFSGPAAVYEITRSVAGTDQPDPVRIVDGAVGGGGTTLTFQIRRDLSAGAPAERRFLVVGASAVSPPAPAARAVDPVLADPSLAADLIVIASPGGIDASPGGGLDALLARRLAQGLTSRLVFVDRIYDEFGYGLRSPEAIRAFLDYAYLNWRGPGGDASPPSFVLLVGDAGPDYKNTLGRADWIDQVPTAIMFNRNSIFGYYSSDNRIAAFRGDDALPDVHLGRISTRTAAEADAVFEKIVAQETAPPPGLWKGRAILVAGDGNVAGEADGFEAVQNGVASAYFSSPPMSSVPLYFENPPWNAIDAAGFRGRIVDELDAGAALLSYVGHGSFDTWGPFFDATDAAALVNPRRPFMVNVNCLAGGFHFLVASGSLGEVMVNNPDGGATAAFAPSGLSNVFSGDVMTADFLGTIFGVTREPRLGVAASVMRAALWSQGSILDLQSYTFLGDPASRVVTPAPEPPSALAATAGNGEVAMSWTASPEPVAGYSIYRATFATGRYARVTCEPTGASSCVDRAVVNNTTYFYYAVSRDAEGFEGRASNLNGDCGSGGPDCVSAKPSNPDPPGPPAAPVLQDAGTGGRLLVSWPANPENDIKSYVVHWGTATRAYSASVTLGAPATSTAITGLTDGVRYFVALTAVNTSGRESALSPESSEVPHLFLGVAPPRAIRDLQVIRSGGDLVLSWSRPLTDIYGRPTTVARYDVYRGSAPGFQPFAGSPIAVITDPAGTTFTDPGAAASPASVFYLVTAVDTAGLTSGAGHDLPNGIATLSVTSIDASTVRLAWPAVETDVQGSATTISRYQVHRATRPIGRAALDASTLFAETTGTSLDVPVVAGTNYFSVVAVDNRGNLSPF